MYVCSEPLITDLALIARYEITTHMECNLENCVIYEGDCCFDFYCLIYMFFYMYK